MLCGTVGDVFGVCLEVLCEVPVCQVTRLCLADIGHNSKYLRDLGGVVGRED